MERGNQERKIRGEEIEIPFNKEWIANDDMIRLHELGFATKIRQVAEDKWVVVMVQEETKN